jgi:hypothetical protein
MRRPSASDTRHATVPSDRVAAPFSTMTAIESALVNKFLPRTLCHRAITVAIATARTVAPQIRPMVNPDCWPLTPEAASLVTSAFNMPSPGDVDGSATVTLAPELDGDSVGDGEGEEDDGGASDGHELPVGDSDGVRDEVADLATLACVVGALDAVGDGGGFREAPSATVYTMLGRRDSRGDEPAKKSRAFGLQHTLRGGVMYARGRTTSRRRQRTSHRRL